MTLIWDYYESEWCEGCGAPTWGNSCPACGAIFEDEEDDPFDDRAISIPEIPPSLRDRVSEADWSLFDHDRELAPRAHVVRAALVALMLAVLASLGAVAATGGFR